MAQTKLMRADEIAAGFNGVAERRYWKASVAGTRTNPEVNFNSRSSMVRVTYRISDDSFTVSFSRTSAAFGDFLASAYRSLEQVLASCKAAGLPFPSVVDETAAALRIGYDPRTKDVFVHIVRMGDLWLDTDPAGFKDPVRAAEEKSPPAEKSTLFDLDL